LSDRPIETFKNLEIGLYDHYTRSSKTTIKECAYFVNTCNNRIYKKSIVYFFQKLTVNINLIVTTNAPSNFLKSVCAQNFLCATFYQHSSIFRTTRMIYVQKYFLRKIYVRSKFPCVRSSHDLCERAHTHRLEGTLVTATNRPTIRHEIISQTSNYFSS